MTLLFMRMSLAIVVLASLSACTVSGPKVKIKAPPVAVEVGEPAQKHCPPGQAKKGNC